MPRIRTGKGSGTTPPSMRQSPPTDPRVLNQQRQAVAMLVSRNTPKEDIYFAMVQQFPDVTPQGVERMRAAAQRFVEQEIREHVTVLRAKQRQRLTGLINQAIGKGAVASAIQGERLLAEIDGTLAPREVVISADATTRDALAALLTILPPETLARLADGKWVPLGYVGPNGAPVITVGSDDGT